MNACAKLINFKPEIYMKLKNTFIFVLIVSCFYSCDSQSIAPGYKFSNFDNTPLSELAKAVKSEDTIAIKTIVTNSHFLKSGSCNSGHVVRCLFVKKCKNLIY
jgi:hypothetical protein